MYEPMPAIFGFKETLRRSVKREDIPELLTERAYVAKSVVNAVTVDLLDEYRINMSHLTNFFTKSVVIGPTSWSLQTDQADLLPPDIQPNIVNKLFMEYGLF